LPPQYRGFVPRGRRQLQLYYAHMTHERESTIPARTNDTCVIELRRVQRLFHLYSYRSLRAYENGISRRSVLLDLISILLGLLIVEFVLFPSNKK